MLRIIISSVRSYWKFKFEELLYVCCRKVQYRAIISTRIG